MFGIKAGMEQKDLCSGIYKAGIAGNNAPRAVFSSLVGRLGIFVFTAPVAEPTSVSFTVPLDGSTIVATATGVTSYSSSADCFAQRPLGAARLFASRCRVMVVLLLVVLTILFGTV